jgi:hypothetical protein
LIRTKTVRKRCRRTTAARLEQEMQLFQAFHRFLTVAVVRQCAGWPPLTAKTGVRVPLGAPIKSITYAETHGFVSRLCPVRGWYQGTDRG